MTERFWVKYPDGSHTGLITDSRRLAQAYASKYNATVHSESEPMPDIPQEKPTRPPRLAARTPALQAGDEGSNPSGDASIGEDGWT